MHAGQDGDRHGHQRDREKRASIRRGEPGPGRPARPSAAARAPARPSRGRRSRRRRPTMCTSWAPTWRVGNVVDARVPLVGDAAEHDEQERAPSRRRPAASRSRSPALGALALPYSRMNRNAPIAKSANSRAPRSCTSDPKRVSLEHLADAGGVAQGRPDPGAEHARALHDQQVALGEHRRRPRAPRSPPRRRRGPRPAPPRARPRGRPAMAPQGRRPDEPAEGEQAEQARRGRRSRGSASWCPRRRSRTAPRPRRAK